MYGVISSKTRKISKLYGAISAKTRNIKKVYGVIGGVTKLIYTLSSVSYPLEFITSSSNTSADVNTVCFINGAKGTNFSYYTGYPSSTSSQAYVTLPQKDGSYNYLIGRTITLTVAGCGVISTSANPNYYCYIFGTNIDENLQYAQQSFSSCSFTWDIYEVTSTVKIYFKRQAGSTGYIKSLTVS